MLKEQIQQDFKAALKAGDALKKSVLSMLLSAVKNRELVKRGVLSKTIQSQTELESQSGLNDQETMEVIAGEAKKRKESITQFIAGHRPELARKEEAELEILKTYLPQQANDEEIKKVVKDVINKMGDAKIGDMGRVMGQAMSQLKGKAEGDRVSAIVKEELSHLA